MIPALLDDVTEKGKTEANRLRNTDRDAEMERKSKTETNGFANYIFAFSAPSLLWL